MRRRARRRKLSMTSLIDVIFLLLLFFMLSSTFTRFAEVELAAGGAGGGVAENGAKPVFLSLGPDSLRVNGTDHDLAALAEAVAAFKTNDVAPLSVLVAMRGPVTAQRLTDLLAALRPVAGVRVTVLETT